MVLALWNCLSRYSVRCHISECAVLFEPLKTEDVAFLLINEFLFFSVVKIACQNIMQMIVTSFGCGLFSGYGVVAEKEFTKGDFIAEYRGELIDYDEAMTREKVYDKQNAGCFMYYFKHNERTVW